MKSDKLHEKIYNADLVIWIFNNWALSMNNLETMILKTSIITFDKWWIIKKDLNELTTYINNIYLNYNFRIKEIEKNYRYVIKKHSVKNFRKNFIKL